MKKNTKLDVSEAMSIRTTPMATEIELELTKVKPWTSTPEKVEQLTNDVSALKKKLAELQDTFEKEEDDIAKRVFGLRNIKKAIATISEQIKSIEE